MHFDLNDLRRNRKKGHSHSVIRLSAKPKPDTNDEPFYYLYLTWHYTVLFDTDLML